MPRPLKLLKINLKNKSFNNSIDCKDLISSVFPTMAIENFQIYSAHITGKCICETFPCPFHNLIISPYIKHPRSVCPKKFVALCKGFSKKMFPYTLGERVTLRFITFPISKVSSLTFAVQTITFQAKCI